VQPSNRVDWLIAAGVLALAMLVRLTFLFSSPDRAWPHSIWYEGDAPEWVHFASALNQGRDYEFNLPMRSPAVAYLLHWMSPKTGPGGALDGPFTPFKIWWCGLSAIACALSYLAFRCSFDRRISAIGAGLCVFSFGSYITATSLNNETLYTFLISIIALLTFKWLAHPRWWIAAALGLAHGLAMLVRAEHLLLLIMSIGYMSLPIVSRVARSSASPLMANSQSAAAGLATIVVVAIATCLPWSIRGSLATQRFNAVSAEAPDYDRVQPRWTPEARAMIESLPAFARQGNFQFITYLASQARKSTVTVEDVNAFFNHRFGYVPEPLPSWTLLSLKGPLDFALANDPRSGGEFSKIALATRDDPDPSVSFGRPDHLRIINHGYEVGFNSIRSDIPAWLNLVGLKLIHFMDGVTLGFTAHNAPVGREGLRRPIDLMTTPPEQSQPIGRRVVAWSWRFIVVGLLATGLALSAIRRTGGFWMTIILSKLVVTILFYGYARQAVSILPAFFIFVGVALDWMIARAGWPGHHDWRPRIGTLACLAAALAMDFHAAIQHTRYAPAESVTPAPQWGAGAFESYKSIHLRAAGSATNASPQSAQPPEQAGR